MIWRARLTTLAGVCLATVVVSLTYPYLGYASLGLLLVTSTTVGWYRGPVAGAASALILSPGTRLLLAALGDETAQFQAAGFGPGFVLIAACGAGGGLLRANRNLTELARRRDGVSTDILKLVTDEHPFSETIDALARRLEAELPGARCSILTLDAASQTLHPAAAPSLPEAFLQAIDGLPIGPSAGPCGTAAYTGQLTEVRDIQKDPRWADFRELAAEHGVRACWSLPFFSRDGVLGTFAIYYDHVDEPTPLEIELVEDAARLASLCVARENSRREQRALEEQVQLSQKLEGLGLLAGGIAHDFNNMLVAIIGNAELLALELEDAELRDYVSEIQEAASRAAGLADQMLTYAGKRQAKQDSFDLTSVIHEFRRLVAPSISKEISVELDLASDLPPLDGDVALIGQVLMNLIRNAAEAIGEQRGRITLRTRFEELTSADLARMLLGSTQPPGRYVILEVEDDGEGLDEAARDRIFDPFFSTRARGHGLGLSIAFGTLRAHGAAIGLESKAGKGSTFRVAFTPGELRPVETGGPEVPPFEGRGLALVIDDELVVQRVASAFLQRLGFQVVVADGAESGARIFEERASEIQLLLVDLSMPGKGGRELLRELEPLPEHVHTILTTGFDPEDLEPNDPGGNVPILRKPYELKEFERVVRSVFAA